MVVSLHVYVTVMLMYQSVYDIFAVVGVYTYLVAAAIPNVIVEA